MPLFGPMAVERDGKQLAVPSVRGAWSLLARLALAPGPQPRGDLASPFRPDMLDSSARASLRSAVWSLRQALGPEAGTYLVVDRNHVGLVSTPELRVGAVEFDALVAGGRERDDRGAERGRLLQRAARGGDSVQHRPRGAGLRCSARHCSPAVFVRDLERAREFYERLGLTVTAEVSTGIFMAARGGTIYPLIHRPGATPPSHTVAAFQIEDLPGVVAGPRALRPSTASPTWAHVARHGSRTQTETS